MRYELVETYNVGDKTFLCMKTNDNKGAVEVLKRFRADCQKDKV